MPRRKYVSRVKRLVEHRYHLDGVFGEYRYYKAWVYTDASGMEFITLEYPQAVYRDGRTRYVNHYAVKAY